MTWFLDPKFHIGSLSGPSGLDDGMQHETVVSTMPRTIVIMGSLSLYVDSMTACSVCGFLYCLPARACFSPGVVLMQEIERKHNSRRSCVWTFCWFGSFGYVIHVMQR